MTQTIDTTNFYSTPEILELFRDLRVAYFELPENSHLVKCLSDKVIIRHMDLVTRMARGYVRRRAIQFDIDEYQAVGYFSLVVALANSLKYCAGNNDERDITRYLIIYVRRMFDTHFMASRSAAPIPKRTYNDMWSRGRADLLTQGRTETYNDYDVYDGDGTNEQDLLIDLVTEFPNTVERNIVKLKMDGYSEREIEVLLNLTHLEFRKIKTAIKRRFEKKLKDTTNAS